MRRTPVELDVNATAERARRAVAAVFIVNGAAFASWASRTPGVKSSLDLDATSLGLLLLCSSVGSLSGMPLSGAAVHRFGAAMVVLGGAVCEFVGLLVAALGLQLESPPLTGAGLLVLGLGIGTWDVAMNVEGAAVERRLARSIMSRFHAGWSLGSVGGAGFGALAAWAAVSVAVQLTITAVLLLVAAVVSVRFFTPRAEEATEVEEGDEQPVTARGSRALLRAAWTDRRTLVVGLMVLSFAFSEGSANDWSAVAIVDGLGTSEATGAIGFGCFLAAMTVARLVGGSAIDRWGRVAVLRGSTLSAATGVLLVVLAPGLGWTLVGAVLWGTGTAVGFPTGISAAADDEAQSAIRVSVVSSIGYTAFLAGPPLIGLLGDAFTIRTSLLVVLVALVVAFLAAPAARQQSTEESAYAG